MSLETSVTGLQHSVKRSMEMTIYHISCMCSLQTAKPRKATVAAWHLLYMKPDNCSCHLFPYGRRFRCLDLAQHQNAHCSSKLLDEPHKLCLIQFGSHAGIILNAKLAFSYEVFIPVTDAKRPTGSLE